MNIGFSGSFTYIRPKAETEIWSKIPEGVAKKGDFRNNGQLQQITVANKRDPFLFALLAQNGIDGPDIIYQPNDSQTEARLSAMDKAPADLTHLLNTTA